MSSPELFLRIAGRFLLLYVSSFIRIESNSSRTAEDLNSYKYVEKDYDFWNEYLIFVYEGIHSQNIGRMDKTRRMAFLFRIPFKCASVS